jgi:hypothetical protein
MTGSFCPWCGAKASGGFAFCRKCGKQLQERATEGGGPEQPAEPLPTPISVPPPPVPSGTPPPAPSVSEAPLPTSATTPPPPPIPSGASLPAPPGQVSQIPSFSPSNVTPSPPTRPNRRRAAMVVAIVVVIAALVVLGALAAAGLFSPSPSSPSPGGGTTPPPSGPRATNLTSGSLRLTAKYTVAEGDGIYSWPTSAGGATFWIGWTTSFPASVCLLNSNTRANYTACQDQGGTSSSYQVHGSVQVGVAGASYASESYSFVEQPGYTDQAYGSILVNDTGGNAQGENGQLAVLNSYPLQVVWSSDTFSLPVSDDHFEFWFNASSEGPLESLSVSASDGASCASDYPAQANYPEWTCTGTYVDQGQPTFHPVATFTAVYNLTAFFALWVW